MRSADSERRVAIVCDTVPYPIRSGDNKRLSELIEVLRDQGWFVHLVLTALVDRPSRQLCAARVDAVHFYQPKKLKTRARNLLRRSVRFFDRRTKVFGLEPLEVIAGRLLGRKLAPIVADYWKRYPEGLSGYLDRLMQRHAIGAVIVEYIWLHPAIDELSASAKRILDTNDLQYKRAEDFAARGMKFPLEITREEESRIFKKFDSVIAIQEQEASLIREMCPGLRVLTVGTACSDLRRIPDAPLPGRILYVGGYNGANIDGLDRFLKNCWPEIIRACPRAHLNVCGYVHRAFASGDFPQVTFLGHVADVEAQYAEAELVVNPLWIGTGLKIKTVEAIAAGKPLVTTPTGIEGMPEETAAACVVASAEKDFSAAVLRLLADAALRRDTARAAAAFAATHLTPQNTYRELLEFLER
jgi:glycosyltransferase involved in cell wall biosynthesis